MMIDNHQKQEKLKMELLQGRDQTSEKAKVLEEKLGHQLLPAVSRFVTLLYTKYTSCWVGGCVIVRVRLLFDTIYLIIKKIGSLLA